MSQKQISATMVFTVYVTIDRKATDEETKEALCEAANEAMANLPAPKPIIHECDDSSLID